MLPHVPEEASVATMAGSDGVSFDLEIPGSIPTRPNPTSKSCSQPLLILTVGGEREENILSGNEHTGMAGSLFVLSREPKRKGKENKVISSKWTLNQQVISVKVFK